jgi:hypothetical protein
MKLEDKMSEILERQELDLDEKSVEFAFWLLEKAQEKKNSKLPANWKTALEDIVEKHAG